jgi:type III pantothenate kinase
VLTALDIGNTTAYLGIFKENQLVHEQRILTNSFNIDILQPGPLIVSSVVPKITNKLKAKRPDAEFVSHTNIPYIKVAVSHPEQVGADRLVNAVAGWKLFGGPLMIVDFGTAVTCCAVARDGAYVGGAIAPGITLSLKALSQGTAQLPQIDFAPPGQPVGPTTTEALRAGIYYQVIGLIRVTLEKYRAVLGDDTKVIATGGHAELFAGELAEIHAVEPYLTLKGLDIIYNTMSSR